MKNLILFNLIILLITTIKLTASTTGEIKSYYYSNDNKKLFSSLNSATGIAVTLNNRYSINEDLTTNLSFVLFDDLGKKMGGSIEPFNINNNTDLKGYIGIANVDYKTEYFNIFVGRQEITTPLVGSINMYLTPSQFEAIQIKGVPLKGKEIQASLFYINKLRALNSGSNFSKLNGDNFGLNLSCNTKKVTSNIWYYNIDEKKYNQVYADTTYNINNFNIQGQYVETRYNEEDNSQVYGLKFSIVKDFPVVISGSFNKVNNTPSGHLQLDSLYTSSWNTFTSDKTLGESYKLDLFKKFLHSTIYISYALYDDMHEFDFIHTQNFGKDFSLKTALTNTEYNSDNNVNAIELSFAYKF